MFQGHLIQVSELVPVERALIAEGSSTSRLQPEMEVLYWNNTVKMLYRPRETFKFSLEYYREPVFLEKYDLSLFLLLQQLWINFEGFH